MPPPYQSLYNSLITQWRFWFLPYMWLHFTSVKNMKWSVMFSKNGVLLFNWKENKEAGANCFEIRIPRKKKKELHIMERPIKKIYGSYFIMEKNIFFVCQWFGILSLRGGVNILVLKTEYVYLNEIILSVLTQIDLLL